MRYEFTFDPKWYGREMVPLGPAVRCWADGTCWADPAAAAGEKAACPAAETGGDAAVSAPAGDTVTAGPGC